MVRLALVVCVAWTIPTVAHASEIHWGVGGRALLSSGGSDAIGYGTDGDLWVYPKQQPQDGVYHVNSIYARTYAGSAVEVGWSWGKYDSAPRCFTHYYNYATGAHIEYDIGTVTASTWTPFTLRQSSTDADTYQMWVDGVYKFAWTNTGITSSLSEVGAERYDTLDHGKGAWTYIRYYKNTGSGTRAWTYWPAAKQVNKTTSSDPFNFYTNKVGNSNHYVYVDDHVN